MLAGSALMISAETAGRPGLEKTGLNSESTNSAPAMQPLKLIALDEEDLAVVSSHLQDAVVRVGDMMPSNRGRT